MNNIWIDKNDFKKQHTYLDIAEWVQRHFYWGFKAFSKRHKALKASKLALQLNHHAFYRCDAQTHVTQVWDILKKIKSFADDDKKLILWCNKGFEKVDKFSWGRNRGRILNIKYS